jgi:hypothetical protein
MLPIYDRVRHLLNISEWLFRAKQALKAETTAAKYDISRVLIIGGLRLELIVLRTTLIIKIPR